MTYKLAAFDMDGTLLDSQKRIPQETLDAIKKARSAGKIVCLSTGRSMPELDIFEGGEFDDIQYFIAASGGIIWDNWNKRFIYEKTLSQTEVEALFEIVRNQDVMIHLHSQKAYIQRDKLENLARYNMGIYKPMFNKICVQPENIEELWKKERFPVYKFNVYCSSLQQRQLLHEKISKTDRFSAVNAERTNLECSPKEISKASGLIMLCQKLGIGVNEAIAVGDAENDLQIIKTAGLGVAMGNACQSVKAAAGVTVSDNDSGGCAEVIEKYLLGE